MGLTLRHAYPTTRGALRAAVSAAVLAAAGAAAAQTATGPQAQATSVGEIVVTATKRSEKIQNVPASITALPAQALAQAGLVRLEDYVAQVPGLSYSGFREGSTQFIIRGITTGVAQSAASTAIYVDEAPVGSVNAFASGNLLTPDLDPAELSQIEVLKGPQGTLYGAGAVGGLIKFVTTPADLDHYSGRLSAGVSTVDGGGSGYNYRGLINAPLVADKLAVRVSGFYREDPGFLDNVTGKKDDNDSRVFGGRADVTWQVDPHLSVDLSALIQGVKDYAPALEWVNGQTLKPIYGDLTFQAYIPQPGYTQMNIYNGLMKGNWGTLTLTSSTTYEVIHAQGVGDGTPSYGALLGELFGIPDFGIREQLWTATDRFAQEFRASNTAFDGALDYQLGLYFTHERDNLEIPGFQPFNTVTLEPIPFPTIIHADIASRYTEYSGYANATWHFSPRFDVLAGVRYSYDTQNYTQDYSGLLVGPEIINQAKTTDSVATFLVSPRFRINPDNMVYVRIANGYRPGGPNALPPAVINAPPSFAPDKLTSYEAGYKGELFDRTVSIQAAAFYTKWDDIQIQTSEAGFNFYVNGGSARSDGGEVSLSWQPVRGLTLGANGALTDTALTSDAPAAGGVNGDELPFVPKWTGALSAAYEFPLMNDWTGVVGGSVNYIGSRASDFSQRAEVTVPGYTTVNLNAGLTLGRYSLSLYAKNLNNARGVTYLKSLGITPDANPFGAGLIQPRTFGLDLAARF